MTNRVNRSVRRRRKVYRWTAPSTRAIQQALGDPAWHAQHVAIVAVANRNEAAKAAGVDRPGQLFNLVRAWKGTDVEAARSRPGVVFVRSLNSPGSRPIPSDEVPNV